VIDVRFLRHLPGASCALFALTLAHASAAPAPAPSPSPAASATPLPEIGHVVTSDRQPEAANAAARTTYVVPKSEMIARGYASVADALTSVPGVVIERYGAYGSAANVGIRGSSSAQVLVLLDGRPIGSAELGTVDLGAISTSGVERIEIVEGGGATLYGAGAIGGVVNIITARPASAPAFVKLTAGSFDATGGDVETRNLSFEHSLAGNDYGYLGITVPSGNRINADAASTTARFRDNWTAGAWQIAGSAGISQEHEGVPGPVALPYASPPPNPALASSYQSSTTRQNDVDEDARLAFSLQRGDATTTFDLSGTRDTLLYYSSPGDPAGCYTLAGTPCNDLNVESRLQFSARQTVATASDRLIYGVDLARGTARIDAGDGAPPAHAFAQTAAYAQDAVQVGRASVYGGIRAERDGGQGGAIAPSAGVIEPLGGAFSLRANVADGFRAPTAVDLYYPGFSNPNLQPERTQSFDATVTDARLLGGTSLAYFTTAGNNLIVVNPAFNYSLAPGPTNEPVINAQHTSVAGLTLDAKTLPLRGFTATLGVTDLYRALDLTSTATRLVGRPVFSTSLALEYQDPLPRALVAQFGVVATGMGARSQLPVSGPVDPTQYAAAYTAVNAYLRLRATPHALVTLRALNLGNERYSAIASPPYGGYPAPGRAFAVELSTR
jgi:vitamin B12 transporter